MMPPDELNDPGGGARVADMFGSDLAVNGAAVYGAPQFHAGRGRRQATAQPNPFGDHDGHAVAPSLLALSDVVEQSGRKEYWIAVAAGEKPTGGVRGVDDVSRVLPCEQRNECWRKPLASEGVVVLRRENGRVAKLADSPQHQTMSFRIWFPSPPMTQPMGL